MSKNDLQASSGQEVNVKTSTHSQQEANPKTSEHSQQDVNLKTSEHSQGASERNEVASEHSMTVPGSSEYSMRGICSYVLKEPISDDSIATPVFGMEGEQSLESLAHPYDSRDKDFVNAKAFLLKASTESGLNL